MLLLSMLFAVPALGGIAGLPIGPDSRGDMQCPRSKSPIHAYGKITVMFQHPCEEVQDEIHARLKHGMTNMNEPWYDPHNNGTYKDLGMGMYDGQYTMIQTERIAPGFPHFKDKQYFTFMPQTELFKDIRRGGGGNTKESCLVYACSVSQGVSATDGGTNFCNLHDLYCNSMDNCQWVKHDLNYNEQKHSVNIGSRANKWICTGRPPRYLHEDPDPVVEAHFTE
jgi:hypothetical protein